MRTTHRTDAARRRSDARPPGRPSRSAIACAAVAIVAAGAVPLGVRAGAGDGDGDVDRTPPQLSMGDVLEAMVDPDLEVHAGWLRYLDPMPTEAAHDDDHAHGHDDHADGEDDVAHGAETHDGHDHAGELAAAAAGDLPPATDGATLEAAQPDVEAASPEQAFSLHSRPGATKVIYLDFDGHVTRDTAWNDSSRPTITSGVYSRERAGSEDGALSSYELDGIVDIWGRVAEDFAPWDVDVTTQDPGVDALSRTTSTDQRYGVRVVVSPDYEWLSTSRFGGVAYVGSFDSYDLPAFVFSSNLANGNPKSVAEAVSHEVGHTLDLRHDGIDRDGTTSSYYGGHGDWAPIMGVGYQRRVTQWSKGEYTGATNTEDDLALIDGHLTRRPTPSGGAALGGADTTTRHVLARGGATARHPLTVVSGPVVVRVEKYDPLGNLLADLVIRGPGGEVVDRSSPLDPDTWSLTATVPVTAPPGDYSIEVRSIGWGSADTGFTSYASMGEYLLSVDVPDAVADRSVTSSTTTTTVTPRPTTTTTTTPPKVGVSGPTTTTPPAATTTTTTTTTPPPAARGADRLRATRPTRVLDTRSPGAASTRLGAGQTIRLDVPGIPASASAVVANVAAVGPSGDGFLSVTPCTSSTATSSLNYAAGRNIGNSIIARLTDDGAVCIFSSQATDVLLDVTGWLGPEGTDALRTITSRRVVDTRTGTGIGGPLVAGRRTRVELGGVVDVATNAVALNVTAVNPQRSGYVTIDDCESTVDTSSLNFSVGRTRGNNGIFTLGAGRVLCVTSSVPLQLTIDVTGLFGLGEGLTFVPADPVRLLDTRATGRLPAGASIGYQVPDAVDRDGVRRHPRAASVNVAAAQHGPGGFVTTWSCGARPATSALNPVAGVATANSALVALTGEGRSCLFHATGGQLLVDLNGWWI